MENKSDANVLDEDLNSPFHMILENHHVGIDVIRMMVLYGANDFQFLTKVDISKERGGNMIKKFYDKISIYEGPLFHEEPG